MKQLLHRLIRSLLRNKIGYFLAMRLTIVLGWHLREIAASLNSRIAPEGIVLSGPFKGLRYPTLASSGSVLLPKLLGAYESEIHTALEQCLASHPDLVVNIGCGEGYYAVGVAQRLPDARVIAYDMDPRAVAQCCAMAQLNEVESRVDVQGACSPENLQKLPSAKRLLVLCDCEGYEAELLRPENFAIKNYDVLVELHRLPDCDLAQELPVRFAMTHEARLFQQTVRNPADYPRLTGLSAFEKALALEELRPYQMSWLLLKSKQLDGNGEA